MPCDWRLIREKVLCICFIWYRWFIGLCCPFFPLAHMPQYFSTKCLSSARNVFGCFFGVFFFFLNKMFDEMNMNDRKITMRERLKRKNWAFLSKIFQLIDITTMTIIWRRSLSVLLNWNELNCIALSWSKIDRLAKTEPNLLLRDQTNGKYHEKATAHLLIAMNHFG